MKFFKTDKRGYTPKQLKSELKFCCHFAKDLNFASYFIIVLLTLSISIFFVSLIQVRLIRLIINFILVSFSFFFIPSFFRYSKNNAQRCKDQILLNRLLQKNENLVKLNLEQTQDIIITDFLNYLDISSNEIFIFAKKNIIYIFYYNKNYELYKTKFRPIHTYCYDISEILHAIASNQHSKFI